MGWLEYEATYYNKRGKIDRKAECDAIFTDRNWCEIVKSTMVGSVYYGAIKHLKRYKVDENRKIIEDENGNAIIENIPEEEQKITAFVVLTHVKDNRWFAYKDMSEYSGPYYYDCPNSILKLLPDTDDEIALEWRKKCRKRAEEKKNSISKLPIGTSIEVEINGKKVILTKQAPAYQFKTPFWMDEKTWRYVKKKYIPKEYKIVEE